MDQITAFLAKIQNAEQRQRLAGLLDWIKGKYPQLKLEYKWNQPMFTDHGTFILAFSVAKHHFSVAPEWRGLQEFMLRIEQAGFDYGTMLFKIKWTDDVPYLLLSDIIDFNIHNKANCPTFWRS